MPELPEVEIIKRELSETINNKKIQKVFSSNLNLHGKAIPNLNCLLNETIQSINRRNKYLIIETNTHYILIHLGMTGQLIYSNALPENQKHIHVVLYFQSSLLYYKDVRRFGMINIYEKTKYPDYLKLPQLSKLGYEPLDDSFTLKKMNECIDKSKANAKKFIMDGDYICGIGNIYANEILFLSKINPTEIINKIDSKTKKLLFSNIIKVLNQAINMGGSTISDFVHTNGKSGSMQDYYYVYGRDGKTCKVCNTKILRTKQNGRSTFYCSNCQK